MGRPRKKKQPEREETKAIADQELGSSASPQDHSPAIADEPNTFAEASKWLTELREMYPEWQPPDPHDPVAMREACDNWWQTLTTRSLTSRTAGISRSPMS